MSAFDALMAGSRAAAVKEKKVAKSMKRKISSDDSSSVGPDTDCVGISKKTTMMKVDAECRIEQTRSKAALLNSHCDDFDPKSAACWDVDGKVPFLFLCRTYDMISCESKTNVKIRIATNMLWTLIKCAAPSELLAVLCLSAYQISPLHEGGSDLGIGTKHLLNMLADAYCTTKAEIKRHYEELGDLGLVAQTRRSSQTMINKPPPLTVAKVLETFRRIAKESGKNSKEKKKNHVRALLVAACDCEPKYLIRLLLKDKLRIGLSELYLLEALACAAAYAEKHSVSCGSFQSDLSKAVDVLKGVHSMVPVYEKIVPALLDGGVLNLADTCSFSLGIPCEPMLSAPAKSVSEIVNRYHGIEYTCEYKYDGIRAQIHCMDDGSIRIFSRKLECCTNQYPDVILAVKRLKRVPVKSCVLDCEIVGYDSEQMKILPLQKLMTRGRKGVHVDNIKINACIFAFDLLYLNGQSLLQEQLKIRRKLLEDSFEVETGILQFATALDSSNLDEIQVFLDKAVNASCEGLVIKTLSVDAAYEPGKAKWVKLKKDYLESMWDSLDLVPIGAYFGKGRRTAFYGTFLLACYDPDKEEFQTVTKAGTGFSEEVLKEHCQILSSKMIPKPKPYYRHISGKTTPDVWFEPSEVWEVKAGGLTISPVYCAGSDILNSNKGFSLRNPTLIRPREDKSPEQATTSKQIAEMYFRQWQGNPHMPPDDEEINS